MSEIDAVRAVLDKDWPDGTTSDDVASAAIKALDAVRSTTWRPLGPPLKVGMAFKSIISSKTHYVLWIGEEAGREYAWLVTSDSHYGTLTLSSSPLWRWVTEARVQQRTIDKVLKNDTWSVGDRLTMRQGNHYEILAVFCNGVLMRDQETGLVWSETNDDLIKWYKKEKEAW